MSFDQAAILTLIDNVVSHASKLGIFRSVNSHEPKAAPGSGLRYAAWTDVIEPLGAASGLGSTSGYVVMMGRITGNMLQKPEDEIDIRMITAASTLMKAYSGDFDFGATVRAIDLLGMYGEKLKTKAGYIQYGQGWYRTMDVIVPIIFNDMWDQVP